MFNLCDEDLDKMELVEGALALNYAINTNVDVEWARKELERLLKEVELILSHETDAKRRFELFLYTFYSDWGFKGSDEVFFPSENAFIDEVLKTKEGIAISLGAIFLFFAGKLGFPAEGVSFSAQFIVKLTWTGEEAVYINPCNGEFLSERFLAAWLIGEEGPLAQLTSEHLKTADNPMVIGQWLSIIKKALMREESYALVLQCSNLALRFAPEDPYEIRDRGFVYQQLGCYQLAKSDYQFFIKRCPQDPTAKLLEIQLKILDLDVTTIH